jgi:hypothetical protein
MKIRRNQMTVDNLVDSLANLDHPGDSIRIVPLYVPGDTVALEPGAAAAAPPHLTYRGGPLLTGVKVFTVFWGAQWEQPALSQSVTNLNGFFDFILKSALIDQLGEYSVPAYSIGHGSRIGSATVTTPPVTHRVFDGAVQHMLRQEIAVNSNFPQPDANTLYFVYLPPGVVAVQGGSRSCQAFCGYHNDIAGRVFYALMPYPGCLGCTGTMNPFEALTSTSSHELCESITDPIPGQGWYDDVNGEIGDICAWQTKQVGAYTVQKEWSNSANACV